MEGSRCAERRSMQRQPAGTIGPIQIICGAPTEPVTVSVADLSLQGLGLLASAALPPGTLLAVQPADHHKRVPNLSATVRHATARPDGRWVLGCVLSRYLTVDDLIALG
ncbi:MAG: PilZ domain-containing protein [Gemmataceae bacterium]|nr:PilZ domain-containing protein [Gemmataceae bacterium]